MTQQVGFNVQLLDSKCYSLLTNEGILEKYKENTWLIKITIRGNDIVKGIELIEEPGPS